jgi:glycosyltransferase involved in cell wall biosynthesis
MAVKNTEPYLCECLDSILAQTYTNWELIAVNDHSSDGSLEVLQQYALKDRRILFINSPRHKLIPALKEGYKHIKGSLLNRMDSDDIMPNYKLEIMVEKWQKYGKGTIIAGGTQHFIKGAEVGEGFKRYDKWLNQIARDNSYYEEIYQECVIPSHCWLIHREDFEMAGGFEPEVYPEDYDLVFRFYKRKFKVKGIAKVLHFWRDREERISRTWDCYKDNRYFELKLNYFYQIDRDKNRPLILWGAGRNGKDMAKLLLQRENNFHWVCDNEKKIGKEIYGINLSHFENVKSIDNAQTLIVVSSPSAKREIKSLLKSWKKSPVIDYWFFN